MSLGLCFHTVNNTLNTPSAYYHMLLHLILIYLFETQK